MGIAKHLISPAKTGPHQESQICEESRSPSPRPADSSLSLGVPPKSGPKFGDLATQLLGHECHNNPQHVDMSRYVYLFDSICLSIYVAKGCERYLHTVAKLIAAQNSSTRG